jgi:hypothetical protein
VLLLSRESSHQPISPKRLAANRANAARSTGPRTPQGKARSAANSRRHRFWSDRFAVVLLEEAAALANIRADLIACYLLAEGFLCEVRRRYQVQAERTATPWRNSTASKRSVTKYRKKPPKSPNPKKLRQFPSRLGTRPGLTGATADAAACAIATSVSCLKNRGPTLGSVRPKVPSPDRHCLRSLSSARDHSGVPPGRLATSAPSRFAKSATSCGGQPD